MRKTTKITQNTKDKKTIIKIIEIAKNKRAKAIFIASAAALLCLATTLIIVLSLPKHPIEKFANKLLKKQNFQVEVTIPILISEKFVMQVDGNIIYVPDTFISEEYYIETIGDVHYKYTRDKNGIWSKKANEEDFISTFFNEETIKQLIDPDNYELVEGTVNVYRQKADIQFEYFKDVVLTLEEDSCKIETITLAGDMLLETQIVISGIGETDLKLPTVR